MYTDFYGFNTKPFQLTPDPGFFYASSGHKRALAYLRYGLGQGEGFVVITGAIGTGKTTLIQNLLNELNGGQIIAARLVTTHLDADNLLRMVVAAFDLPFEGSDKASLIKRFENYLDRCQQQGQRLLLIVDEVQNLPLDALEELRMLSNLQSSGGSSLQCFLLGQGEFRDTLDRPEIEQLRQRIIASSHLNPLSEQETRDYIEYRLQRVGWQNNPRFDDAVYPLIHQISSGVPRRINSFCDRLLLYGFMEQRGELLPSDIETVHLELQQESESSVAIAETPDEPPPPTSSSDSGTEALSLRIGELEKTVAEWIFQPSAEQQSVELSQLKLHIAALESELATLRQGYIALSRRAGLASDSTD